MSFFDSRVSILCSCFALFALTAPASLTASGMAALYTRPMVDDIALCEETLLQIHAAGELRMNQIEQWKGWYASQKEILQAKGNQMMADVKQARAATEKGLATLQGLAPDAKTQVNLPHLGWSSIESLGKRVVESGVSLQSLLEKLSGGLLEMSIAGIGWITGKALEAKIDSLGQEILKISAALAAGTYEVHLNGMGWVSGKSMKARIENQRAARTKIEEAYAKGDFEVHLPALGWTTRNRLTASIDALKKQLAEIGAGYQAGGYTLHRAPVGHISWKNLESQLDTLGKSLEDLKKNISQDIWDTHFNGPGWLNGKKIKEFLTGVENKIQNIEKALSGKNYSAHLPKLGWMTEKQVEEAIAAEQKKQKPDPDLLAHLRAAVAKIRAIATLDVALYLLEKSKYTAWLALVLKLAAPFQEYKKVEFAELQSLQGEFSRERAFHEKDLNRQIERLEAYKQTFFP